MTAITEPGPETLARIRGRCRLCLQPIIPGRHYVSKLDRLGWVHSRCAAGYRQAMAENQEDIGGEEA